MLHRHGHTVFKAADFIVKALRRKLSFSEEKEFSQLREETGLEKQLSCWNDPKTWIQELHQLMEFDTPAAYEQFLQQITPRPKRNYRLRIAATIILLATAGSIGYYLYKQVNPEKNEWAKSIEPVRTKAYIVLADGQQISLQENLGNIREQDGTVISNRQGKLIYDIFKETTGQLLYNTLTVPRGGEFQIILADGTRIWLNSESELKYPVHFTGEMREVFLSGEAYFEVKKDTAHPFVVHTSLGKINVLGTEFNVRTYKDEQQVVTTLLNGKVTYQDLRKPERTVILHPGDQVIAQENAEELTVHPVKLKLYTSWKDGLYIFRDLTLEEIMKTIERNYDVHVFYANEHLKQLRFSGDLRKYERVESFLQFIEIGGDVSFTIKGNTITVISK